MHVEGDLLYEGSQFGVGVEYLSQELVDELDLLLDGQFEVSLQLGGDPSLPVLDPTEHPDIEGSEEGAELAEQEEALLVAGQGLEGGRNRGADDVGAFLDGEVAVLVGVEV